LGDRVTSRVAPRARDESLVSEVEALDGDASLESLTKLANDAGYDFTPEELQQAHVRDWKMRWARYAAGSAPGSRAPHPTT
jgi:hypothetical protein